MPPASELSPCLSYAELERRLAPEAMRPDFTPADVTGIVGNPIYAINIAPALAQLHPPLISEQEWISANIKLIEDLGPEAYLQNLLSILEGNYRPAPVSAESARRTNSGPGDLNS